MPFYCAVGATRMQARVLLCVAALGCSSGVRDPKDASGEAAAEVENDGAAADSAVSVVHDSGADSDAPAGPVEITGGCPEPLVAQPYQQPWSYASMGIQGGEGPHYVLTELLEHRPRGRVVTTSEATGGPSASTTTPASTRRGRART